MGAGDPPGGIEHFRALFQQSPDAVVWIDDEQRLVEVNGAACALLGVDRDGLLGRRLGDLGVEGAAPLDASDGSGSIALGAPASGHRLLFLRDGPHPGAPGRSRSRPAARASALQRVARVLATHDAGWRADGTDPPRLLVEVVAAVGRAVGPTRGALARVDEGGCALDIVDHGLQEAGVMPLDAPHPMAACALHQQPIFAFGEELDRWPLAHRSRELVGMALLPCVVSGRLVGVLALGFATAHTLSGVERQWLIAVARLCALALDRADLQAQADAALEAARAASARKDRFIAMLGHELRNPLAAISAAAAKHGDEEEDWRLVGRHARHLGRMVREMLDAARMMEGAAPLRRAPLELYAAIQLAVDLAQPLLDRHEHALELDVPLTGLTVLGDADRLAQAFVNLLSNAVRYSAPGAPITVRAAVEEGRAVVSVIDGGMGLAPTDIERIFDFFVQGDAHPRRAASGLGLGLAIVRWVVDAHGGEVSAHSRGPDQGSEFVVSLPLHAPKPDATPLPPRRGPPLRLLLVDDNADAATLLGEVLSLLGHEVEVVHDPVEALARVGEGPWDAALVDIELPIMDGLELVARMRDLGAPVARYIAVTGYDRPLRMVAEGRGFDAWLLKPVDPDQLVRCVRAVPEPAS